ncbi:hypothetical protein QVD17_30908 [Tagetes erecta]|uniref:Ubiquitin-like protease family profile domain-containing protein n=1 Tax=Tagetes erecta TaxID=13708 RepID=A0AAD8K643_TARER|nr:hypothetical protein QVD17_30908 [Tagetes erecta]
MDNGNSPNNNFSSFNSSDEDFINMDLDALIEDDKLYKELFSEENKNIAETEDIFRSYEIEQTNTASDVWKSPYEMEQTNTESDVTKVENIISFFLYSMIGNPLDLVFVSENFILSRLYMETLTLGIKVHSNVIDLWSHILNYEEKQKGNKRYYFDTNLIGEDILKDSLSFEKKFDIFKEKMISSMGFNDDLISFKDFDMVYFPIKHFGHYYLLVLNLKELKFLLLDNNKIIESKSFGGADLYVGVDAYGGVPDLLKLTLKWATKENHIDNGIYVMLHMDSYIDEKASSWNDTLLPEGEEQQKQLNRLRSKFATKILLSNLNMMKHEFIKHPENFDAFPIEDKKRVLQFAYNNWFKRYFDYI